MSTKPKPSSGPLDISDRIKARDLRRDDLLARIGIRTPGPRFRFTLGPGVSPLAGDPHKPGILNANIRTYSLTTAASFMRSFFEWRKVFLQNPS